MAYHVVVPLERARTHCRERLTPPEPDEDETVIAECDCCGMPICVGDEYYRSSDGKFYFHTDCLELRDADDYWEGGEEE